MKPLVVLSVVSLTLLMAGCDDEGRVSSSTPNYQITLTNVSHNQPLSPLALALHDSDYQWLGVGASASLGLEVLAEGGDNSTLITEALAAGAVTGEGAGLLMPGDSESLTLSGSDSLLSLASMLVNSNDAFAGLDGVDLSGLLIGERQRLWANTYDAGTEANSEAMADIPGPAAGGEGFNATRDDQDMVRIHSGVITQDDGLLTSVLDQSHRFSGSVLKVEIERLQ